MASVDIVVPCYNYGHFLRDCLASILAQVGVDLRVLVIDDASPDDSFTVATELAAADRRIELVRHRENRGLMATLNEGIGWAEADYLLVLSADDLLVPGCLARAAAVLDRHPNVGLLYGAEGKLVPGAPIPIFDAATQAAASTRILTGLEFVEKFCRAPANPVGTSTAFVRTSVQKAAGGYNPRLPHTSDYEMWLRIAAISDVAETEAVQGIRREHGANMSSYYFSVITRDFAERLAALESFFLATAGKELPGAARHHRLARRRLAEEAYWCGVSLSCRGQPGLGRDLVIFAARLAPSMMVLPPLGYLSRRNNAFHRIVEVLGEAVAGKRRLQVR
jgi:glycosyltransferase involved in cell wall biosynthesis